MTKAVVSAGFAGVYRDVLAGLERKLWDAYKIGPSVLRVIRA